MKRHFALQALSREHHQALVLASTCKRAAQSGNTEKVFETCDRVAREYDADMAAHFMHEEKSLLPLLLEAGEKELTERTLNEHESLRAMVESLRKRDTSVLGDFGKLLSDHVRFEEQELFSIAENRVPDALLVAALRTHKAPVETTSGN
ncbi:MAG: hemerythrin domain-containing protein [Sulfuricella denitrificans]|nr:hemerythrin domain-containing protein [Sulfuricella denitrificans]